MEGGEGEGGIKRGQVLSILTTGMGEKSGDRGSNSAKSCAI